MLKFVLVFLMPLLTRFADAQTCGTTFRVAVNEYPPLYFKSPHDLTYSGLSADVIKELATRTGCKFSAVPTNRSKLIAEMSAARIDLVIVTLKNSTYDKVAEFLPLHVGNRELLLPKSFVKKGQTVKDLIFKSNLRFTVHPGATFVFQDDEAAFLQKADRFVTSPALDHAYNLIKKSKNIGIMQPHFIHAYFMRTLKMDDFTTLEDPTTPYKIGIYYVKKSTKPADIESLKNALENMDRDGTWDRLNSTQY